MKVGVSNFGPVAKAQIEITPMTIIIGCNNLGKSFLSQLIFALASTLRAPRRTRFSMGPQDIGILDLTEYFAEQVKDDDRFKKALSSLKKREISLSDFLGSIINLTCLEYENVFRILFYGSLEKTFGVKTSELVNLQAENSEVILKISPVATFEISIPKSGELSVSLKTKKDQLLRRLLRLNSVNNSAYFLGSKARRDKAISTTINSIQQILFERYDIASSYYLPAGRAGLLESWDTISTAWVNLAPISIPRGISMPPLPGTAAMFYNILHSLTGRRKGHFYNTSGNFRKLLSGELEISTQTDIEGKKDIFYHLKAGEETKPINIIHAASMIKEIGPLYLIIRELLYDNDFFIVEEPESHLHPTAQRDFMNIMVNLTSERVNILFTTHSDILLRTVAHIFGKQSLRSDEDKAPRENLSVYLLKRGRLGSISKRIKVSKSGALEKLPTFDEVLAELYDEEMRLEILSDAQP